MESLLADWKDPEPPLLVAPELSPRVLELCHHKRLAAVDLNGRAYIRAAGILVDRRPLPGRDFRFQLEPRNVFVGKSARIIRTLLTDRDRIWSQSELVDRTKASSGLVSRIVQHLISQGFIEKKSAREFRLINPLELVDAWVKADDVNRRTTTTRYTTFGGSPIDVARQLHTWAGEQSVPIAFTQWIAASLRHPYTEPVVTSAYVARLPEAATLERLGLRPVTDAGKVWLLLPDDEGVFLETRTIQGLPLASDAQIYLDLQKYRIARPRSSRRLAQLGRLLPQMKLGAYADYDSRKVALAESALFTIWPNLEAMARRSRARRRPGASLHLRGHFCPAPASPARHRSMPTSASRLAHRPAACPACSSLCFEKGFHKATSPEGLIRYEKEVGDYSVPVDFLTDAPPHTQGSATVDDIVASVLPGINRALKTARTVRVTGADLAGDHQTATLRVCEVGPFLALKLRAFLHREQPKDAFDILYTLLHYDRGPAAAFSRLCRRDPS